MTVPAYQWQPTSLNIAERLGVPVDEVVRFDQNTSPLWPDWAPEIAATAVQRVNEYPFADYRTLREAAGDYSGVAASWVVPGAGADELISLCAAAFLPFGGIAATAPPTYGLYEIATAHRVARLMELPRLPESFELDLPATIEAAQRADLVWLCVPNNPTGNRDGTPGLVEILESAVGIVIIDAAYAEFADDDWARWVEQYQNLVVLRTMSKAFALAGIRVGYAMAQPPLIAELDLRRPPGSISGVSAAVAEFALSNPEVALRTVDVVSAERDRLAGLLTGLGFEIYPSKANFILFHAGSDASRIADDLMWNNGMVVRSFTGGPLQTHLRITVRSPSDNDRLVRLLKGTMT